jgi:PAS domain S-box-containing protein
MSSAAPRPRKDEAITNPTAPAPARSAASWAERVLDATTMAGGLVCLGVGVTIAVAWSARETAVLRFGSYAPMLFNTALALMVTGAALVVLASRRWPWAALAAGGFDALLGLATIAEYALGRNLGIDQLLMHDYLGGRLPGRPALNTAVCLAVAGLGLLAWAPWWSRPRPAAIAMAGSLIAAIAVTATFGYVSSTPAAYGWGGLSRMALVTALVMLVLGLSLLSAAWRGTGTSRGALPRWLPMPAGLLALGVTAAIWLTVIGKAGRAGRIDVNSAIRAVTIFGLVMAGLVMLAVWAAQQAAMRREAVLAAEAQARATENRMLQFLDAMPVALFVAAPGGRPYYANDEAQRLMGRGVVSGISTEQLAGTYNVYLSSTGQLCPPDELTVVRALRGESSHHDDLEIHQADGTVVPLEVWGNPVYGPDGEVEYGIVAFVDTSDRNGQEQTIAAQAALLDLAHDAVFVRDLDGRISYWNAGAEHTYGFARSEALGRVSHELLSTGFPVPLTAIEAAVATKGRWEGELTHRRADGRTIIVESRWAAQRDTSERLLGFLEINRDVTARKAAQRELVTQAEEIRALNVTLEQRVNERTMHLDQANRNLEAFTYSVAHDLRTPLRALSGYAEALAEECGDELGETGREYAGRIEAASQRMATLIDDLLQLSRVSRAEISLQQVDLSAEVAAAADDLQSHEPDRDVRLLIQKGVVVIADRGLIRTVVENLVGNAWKFTARCADASIEFGTTPTTDTMVCCFVRDNGAGFDPAYETKLFQPFQRLHSAKEFPGTGVGLASVRQIVERHGGRVWAEGAVGTGATFYFTLAAREPAIPAQVGRDQAPRSSAAGPTGPGPASAWRPADPP